MSLNYIDENGELIQVAGNAGENLLDDTAITTHKTWSSDEISNRITHTYMCRNTVTESPVISDDKITSYYDGLTVNAMIVNGHYGNSFTIGLNLLTPKKVYCIKNGDVILMPSHNIDRDKNNEGSQNWYCQEMTKLELLYDTALDSNNGGWIILNNVIVIDSSDGNYHVYSNGTIEYNKSAIDDKHTHNILYSRNNTSIGSFSIEIPSLSQYQAIIIRCIYGNISGEYYFGDNYIELKNLNNGFTLETNCFYSSPRYRLVTINNNILSFTTGYNGSSVEYENYCIPLLIYGVK